MEMRAVQTAGIRGKAAVRMAARGMAGSEKAGVGSRRSIRGGVPELTGDSAELGMDREIPHVEDGWRRRADGAGGERGRRVFDFVVLVNNPRDESGFKMSITHGDNAFSGPRIICRIRSVDRVTD